MAEDTILHPEGESTPIVTPRRLFQPGEEVYKYRLKVPIFAGIEDIEQFISEFNETWAITQWPPRVALVKLWRALTGEAKLYGQRPNIDRIFAALRDRFGTTALDARFRLQRLLRKEDTSLQDHAIVVKRLAQLAYSDLPETQQRRYILEDFTQSINYPGLHHQLQAKGVTSIEAALWQGEAYLQAQRLYETPPQVTRFCGKTPAATINTPSLLKQQRIAWLPSWRGRWLFYPVSDLRPLHQKLPDKPADAGSAADRDTGTQVVHRINNDQTPANRRDREKRTQGGFRRASERTPRHTPREWQKPRRTSRPELQREQFILPHTNRFSQLP